MNKSIKGHAKSVIGHNTIGGTVTEGTRGTIGRHIEVECSPWYVAALFARFIETHPEDMVNVIRGSWLVRHGIHDDRVGAAMRRIADDIETIVQGK